MTELNTIFTPYPVCPHCGKVSDSDYWEWCPDRDGDTAKHECWTCSKEFFVKTYIDYNFSTAIKKEDL